MAKKNTTKATKTAKTKSSAMNTNTVQLPDGSSLGIKPSSSSKEVLPALDVNSSSEAPGDSKISAGTENKEPSGDDSSPAADPDSYAEVEFDSDAGSDAFDEANFGYDEDDCMFVAVETHEGKKKEVEPLPLVIDHPMIAQIEPPPVVIEHPMIARGTPLYNLLNRLPKVNFAALGKKDVGCYLCQEPYVEDDHDVIVRLPCRHLVHRECLASLMGPDELGGFGYRKCLECGWKIVVCGE